MYRQLGEAIRLALERNPTIRIQASQVALNEGLVQQADGAFDYTITALLQGSDGKADRQESVRYQAGVSKLLESGITVGPLSEAEQELSGNVAYTQSIVGLAFTIPLLLVHRGGRRQLPMTRAPPEARDLLDVASEEAGTSVGGSDGHRKSGGGGNRTPVRRYSSKGLYTLSARFNLAAPAPMRGVRCDQPERFEEPTLQRRPAPDPTSLTPASAQWEKAGRTLTD